MWLGNHWMRGGTKSMWVALLKAVIIYQGQGAMGLTRDHRGCWVKGFVKSWVMDIVVGEMWATYESLSLALSLENFLGELSPLWIG